MSLKITINNQTFNADENETILDVAHRNGIDD